MSYGTRVGLAVELVGRERRLGELRAPGGDVLGDVLDQTRVDLLLEHAAAPGGEDVGGLARLRERGELGLVRVVLQDGQLDLDVGCAAWNSLALVAQTLFSGSVVDMFHHSSVTFCGRGRLALRSGAPRSPPPQPARSTAVATRTRLRLIGVPSPGLLKVSLNPPIISLPGA